MTITESTMRLDYRAHLLHPVSSFPQIRSEGPRIFVSGDGIRLRDDGGREFLDCFSGLLNVNVGYGRPELAAAAQAQMAQLPFSTSFFGRSNEPAIRLATRLAGYLPPELAYVHFSNGGSDANETAIKVARLYWHIRGRHEKKGIISRDKSYHGITYGALSATPLPAYWEGFGPLLPGFSHIEPVSAQALEDEIQRRGADTVAAFLAEPIAVPNGLLTPPDTYWDEVQAICAKHDVLLITDEVITGFGRTGKLFGIEHWDIRPDILTMSKGLSSGYVPLGAAAVRDSIAREIEREMETFFHGVTSSGHPVCCAVALANLDIIEDEGLVANAAAMGDRLRASLEGVLPTEDAVEVRGIGLLAAVELRPGAEAGKRGARVMAALQDAGVLARSYGDVIVLGPPLVVSEAEIEDITERVAGAIAGTRGETRVAG